jgi:TolB-like protein/DNA-binding winged helix-turn-helix (wHTH) protein
LRKLPKLEKTYLIGAFSFYPETGKLTAKDGSTIGLRPQSARVLTILAEESGGLVTKEVLMREVWADTHVTDDSLVQCISEIRRALGPQDAKVLTTVPKQGYRISSKSVLQQLPATNKSSAEQLLETGRPAASLRDYRWLGVLAAVIFFASVTAYWITQPEQRVSPITIGVLPFVNASDDETQSYFSSGVSEDLIVQLSNISDMQVLSRGATFSVDQSSQDIREVAQSLGADYLLEGSVRRVKNSLRVSVALVNGTTGANDWAERFEGTPDEIFVFQNEVVNALVRTLSVRLSTSERARLGVQGTRSVEAYDAYLLGRDLENRYTRDDNLKAEEALLSATRMDPNFALAYAHLAQVYSFRVENNWTGDRERYIQAAFANAERAIKLDPKLPFAHFSIGRLYTRSFSPDPNRARAAYETAIGLDPNYVDAFVVLANVHIFDGRAAEALPLVQQALGRNPIPPYWYYLAEGMAHYFLGEYDKAESALIVARDQNPNAPFPYRFLIATYGQLSNVDEAEWMTVEYEALGRTATIEAILASASVKDESYRTLFAEGFRKAGLQEK